MDLPPNVNPNSRWCTVFLMKAKAVSYSMPIFTTPLISPPVSDTLFVANPILVLLAGARSPNDSSFSAQELFSYWYVPS